MQVGPQWPTEIPYPPPLFLPPSLASPLSPLTDIFFDYLYAYHHTGDTMMNKTDMTPSHIELSIWSERLMKQLQYSCHDEGGVGCRKCS